VGEEKWEPFFGREKGPKGDGLEGAFGGEEGRRRECGPESKKKSPWEVAVNGGGERRKPVPANLRSLG